MSAITEELLNKQIKRLGRLPFAPTQTADVEALAEEYKRAFNRCAKSGEHLKAIVDEVMNRAMRCPPPAEILEIAAGVPLPSTDPPAGCNDCRGLGMRHIERNGFEAMEFCSCAKGVWRQQRDRERKGAA